jgi:hypothetical protein
MTSTAAMPSIRSRPLPAGSLLARYAATGAYTDCYTADVSGSISQAQYIEAFYTGGLFRIERHLLGLFVSRPSTDAQVRALARGSTASFSAWRVEDRCDDQLLLCDVAGRTRSWLMASPLPQEGTTGTRLHFGSAVVPAEDRASGRRRMGPVFSLLLGFHRLYSRALLRSAAVRLARADAAAADRTA